MIGDGHGVRRGQVRPAAGGSARGLHSGSHVLQDHVIVDGACIWFEAAFHDDTVLSTSPLGPLTSWGNRLYRIDRELTAGETLRLHVHLGRLVDPSTWTVEQL